MSQQYINIQAHDRIWEQASLLIAIVSCKQWAMWTAPTCGFMNIIVQDTL